MIDTGKFTLLTDPARERLIELIDAMKMDPWDRVINETAYDTDELTALCHVGTAICWSLQEESGFYGRSMRHYPPRKGVKFWFRNFQPGKASHQDASRRFPDTTGALVQFTRFSTSSLPLKVAGGLLTYAQSAYESDQHGRGFNGLLLPVVKPTAKFYEPVTPIGTVLLCEGKTPPDFVKQVLYRIVLGEVGFDTLKGTSGRWQDKCLSMVQEAADNLTITFRQKGRDSNELNHFRLSMARLMEREHDYGNGVESRRQTLHRATQKVVEATEEYRKAVDSFEDHQLTIRRALQSWVVRT